MQDVDLLIDLELSKELCDLLSGDAHAIPSFGCSIMVASSSVGVLRCPALWPGVLQDQAQLIEGL